MTLPRSTPSLTHMAIHPTQFPQQVRRALLDSLHRRQINHKFLYDSFKQTQKWLALHQAYSPSRTDTDCAAAYDSSFAAAVSQIHPSADKPVHLIGLGCGGGQKDARLLKLLMAVDPNAPVFYAPVDVSVAMVLEARQTALEVIPEQNCSPLVCDLAEAADLPATLDNLTAGHTRLFTFFGMLPNFDPEIILPRLSSLLQPQDILLLSANLAPGPDYHAGLARILPLYDNALTRDWLLAFLVDLGFGTGDGQLLFQIEDGSTASTARRIVARFHFERCRDLAIDSEQFRFKPGENIRVFFSYRYTPELVQRLVSQHGLQCCQPWVSQSGEEAIFLLTRSH